MALSATTEVTVARSGGLLTGPQTIGPFSYENTDAPEAQTTQSFAAGVFEAVSVPEQTGSAAISGVIIVPPPGNTGAITVKGITGDTGIPLHKTRATGPIYFDGTPSFGLLCVNTSVMTFIWV